MPIVTHVLCVLMFTVIFFGRLTFDYSHDWGTPFDLQSCDFQRFSSLVASLCTFAFIHRTKQRQASATVLFLSIYYDH